MTAEPRRIPSGLLALAAVLARRQASSAPDGPGARPADGHDVQLTSGGRKEG